MKIRLHIARGGTVRHIYTDALGPRPEAVIQRVSHVEPAPGGWTANMAPVGGPLLGPFPLRAAALTAEQDWLLAHHLPLPLEPP